MSIIESFVLKSINKSGKSRHVVDPAIFDDIIALKTEWGFAHLGSANVETNKLKSISPDRIEFAASNFPLFFIGIFQFIGGVLFIISMLAALLFILTDETLVNNELTGFIITATIGVAFYLIARHLKYYLNIPRVFDKQIGYYWNGHNIKEPSDIHQAIESCPLKDIHAIQLIQKFLNGGIVRSGLAYEFNLVLKSGERLHVVEFSRYKLISEAAEKVSSFIDVPVWDATTKKDALTTLHNFFKKS